MDLKHPKKSTWRYNFGFKTNIRVVHYGECTMANKNRSWGTRDEVRERRVSCGMRRGNLQGCISRAHRKGCKEWFPDIFGITFLETSRRRRGGAIGNKHNPVFRPLIQGMNQNGDL